MDKLLVDGSGDVVVTNDGATLLSEMDISHPVARSLIQVATTQEAEVGDGTTSAVVLAGALPGEALTWSTTASTRRPSPRVLDGGRRRGRRIGRDGQGRRAGRRPRSNASPRRR